MNHFDSRPSGRTSAPLRYSHSNARWALLYQRGREFVLGSNELWGCMRRAGILSDTPNIRWNLRWQNCESGQQQVYFTGTALHLGVIWQIRRIDSQFRVDMNWRVVAASWELMD